MATFRLHAPYQPTGDQPSALKQLAEGLVRGDTAQTLLGVTGSGKTFTMACTIAEVQRPTLVISHNKTLAAQLYSEFKQFFPDNAVEYFVSYYDYYQPEAYIPSTGVYIEKDLAINDEIEKLRLRAASSLLSGRRDVIVIASVSCIYGMSNPAEFGKNVHHFAQGQTIPREPFLQRLVDLLYSRDEEAFKRGTFRVRGDTVDLHLAYADHAYRFHFFGDEIEAIHAIHPSTGATLRREQQVAVFPANLFVTSKEVMREAVKEIHLDLGKQLAYLEEQGNAQAAERLKERTEIDLEMMQELGYCSGIENYSRYFDRRTPEQRPYCLLDYFPNDYVTFIDESHVTMPQLRAMWGGDHARKRHLVQYGFRLPSAMDNRPLSFEEFEEISGQQVFVSATPAVYELSRSDGVIVEQVVRPTGLLDPVITLQPTHHQIDHLLEAMHACITRGERVLVTTLTKQSAEDLAKYLDHASVRCRYLHSEIKTLERVAILEQLRAGVFDVLVGVNLLREGLDLPEVSLVAILDADKEGFLRNERSLIQMIGRAARHVRGHVIMYADRTTKSIEAAMRETARRRKTQMAYNKAHGITPSSVHKKGTAVIETTPNATPKTYRIGLQSKRAFAEVAEPTTPYGGLPGLSREIKVLERAMKVAAAATDFLLAKELRDKLIALKQQRLALEEEGE